MAKVSLFIAMSLDGYIYVVTHDPKPSSDTIYFTDECPVEMVKKITRRKSFENI